MDKEYSFIQELDMSSTEWKLKIRVLRVWDVFNLYDKNNSFVGVDMLFMDEKGDQIHGSMKADIFRSIGGIIQEGAILKLEKFTVQNKSKSFRPVNYEYKITFDNNAIIEPAETEITFPPQKFCFLDFKNIPSKFNENGDLSDVIGFWDKTKYETKDTPTSICSLRNLHINDNDGNAVRIAFWDEMIKQIPELTPHMDQQPVVIIVTSISVKKFQFEYHLQATFASKVYVNFEHPEVASFKSRGMKPSQRLVVTPTRTPKRSRPDFEKDIVDDKKSINEIVSSIMDVSSKDYQSCTATITKVHNDRGWFYVSCKTCFRIVKSRGDKYWCAHCDDTVEFIERFKVQLEIEDGSGTIDITVFADIAEKLIGHSLDSLMEIKNKENDDKPVYEEIEKNVIGKENDFTLRISNYNRKNPTSSLTATKIEPSVAATKKGKQIKSAD